MKEGPPNQVFQFFYYVKKKILAKGGHGWFGQGVYMPVSSNQIIVIIIIIIIKQLDIFEQFSQFVSMHT